MSSKRFQFGCVIAVLAAVTSVSWTPIAVAQSSAQTAADITSQQKQQADALAQTGQYREAIPLYEAELRAKEALHGAKPQTEQVGLLVPLNDLGTAFRFAGEYSNALPLSKRALAISEAALGPEHPDTGVLLNNLAALYKAMGQYTQALPLFQRALAISEKAQGPDHPSTVTSLNNLALLHQAMGQYAQALPLSQRALAISEQVNGPEHAQTGGNLHNLALLYGWMGRYEQALPLFRRALTIIEKASGPEHPHTSTSLLGLADLYRATGRYAQALPLYERALAISEKVAGPEHPSTGSCLHRLAGLYQSIGNFDQALQLYQRALAIAEKANGPEHPNTSASLTSVAKVLRSMGRYDQALPLVQRALAISEKTLGPEHPSTGWNLNSLALLYWSLKRNEVALPLMERALAISEKVNGPDHRDTGIQMNNVATLYASMGHPDRALQLHLRTLTIARKAGSPEFAWNVYANLMALHRGNTKGTQVFRQPALAIWYGKQAVNTLQSVRENMQGLDDDLQEGFLSKNKNTYERLANLLIEAGRIPEAEQVLAMLKEREVFELTRSTGAAPSVLQSTFDGVERTALDEQRQFEAEGVRQSQELAQLERQRKAAGSLPEAEETRRQALLAQAQTWRANYQRFLTSLSERFAQGSRPGPAREADQQATRLQARVALDPAGAIGLHYVVTDERIGIIVATPRGSFGRFSTVPRADLERQIVALRQAILNKADTRAPAQALWKMLIEPVQADIKAYGAQTLVLSLTDNLRYLPFAALQDPAGRYLVQDHALALWAAAADVTPSASKAAWQVTGLGLTEARPGFSALPAVRQELAAIVRTEATQGVLPGNIALNEQFTLSRFEAALTGRTNVLHIASHFDFKPGDESRSVLLLGQGEPISLGKLAVMDFSEIDQLTLSACDTATGGGINENGAEVEGLAAIVLRQQAKSVLATLWKVADASTAKLMQDFYRQRAQDTPPSRAQALRAAQLALLRGQSVVQVSQEIARGGSRADAPAAASAPAAAADPQRPYAHPYYWAPFVLSGSWL